MFTTRLQNSNKQAVVSTNINFWSFQIIKPDRNCCQPQLNTTLAAAYWPVTTQSSKETRTFKCEGKRSWSGNRNRNRQVVLKAEKLKLILDPWKHLWGCTEYMNSILFCNIPAVVTSSYLLMIVIVFTPEVCSVSKTFSQKSPTQRNFNTSLVEKCREVLSEKCCLRINLKRKYLRENKHTTKL